MVHPTNAVTGLPSLRPSVLTRHRPDVGAGVSQAVTTDDRSSFDICIYIYVKG